jgi:hypothetical protein
MDSAVHNSQRTSLNSLQDGLLIPLADVPAWYERLTGRRVSHQAVWAWTKHGVGIEGGCISPLL